MITAKEAFRRSDIGHENYISNVKEIVEHELEDYLAEKIELATNKGIFSTEYWWSLSWFEDQEVDPQDFLHLLCSQLELYGYTVNISQTEERGTIWIYWDHIEEEE